MAYQGKCIEGQRFRMVKFCVIVFEMLYRMYGKKLNLETGSSEQAVFVQKQCLFRSLSQY